MVIRTGISSLSTEGHQGVVVQVASFIVGSLENSRTSHSSLRCCNEGKVLSGNTKENLPRFAC